MVYGSWTRVCAAERCPSIARILGPQGKQQQTSKVYAADGRLISEYGIERRATRLEPISGPAKNGCRELVK